MFGLTSLSNNMPERRSSAAVGMTQLRNALHTASSLDRVAIFLRALPMKSQMQANTAYFAASAVIQWYCIYSGFVPDLRLEAM